MATLKAALQEACRAELEEIPSEEMLCADEALTFTPAFERKMKRLIRRSSHPVRYRAVRAAACFLLALLLGGCAVLTLVPEARAAFVGWVRETYKTWFVYRYVGEKRSASENTVYFPAWVPEEYEKIVSPQAGTFVRAQYENGGQELLTFCYVVGARRTSLNVEWEGAVVRRCSVDGLPADLYLNPKDGPNILVWTDYGRDAAFWITAPLSGEELVRMAESVRESEPMPKRYCVSLLPMNYGAYSIASESEGDGRGEIVYENDQGFFVTFGYSDDAASVPCPGGTAEPVYVGDREGALYPALEANGNKTLLWTTQDGDVLWVRAPLPDEELLLIAENVTVQLNQFTDLMEIQVFDEEAPLLEAVERALTEAYVAQVEACARRDAQAGNYMSEEYRRLWKSQQAKYISPERDEAIARIAALADAFRQEGRYGESIVSLFGPFYTASITVSDYDYSLFFADGMPEGYFDTSAHVVDERGVLIASYHSGGGECIIVPTAEEMQFQYADSQIYIKAYRAAQEELAGK